METMQLGHKYYILHPQHRTQKKKCKLCDGTGEVDVYHTNLECDCPVCQGSGRETIKREITGWKISKAKMIGKMPFNSEATKDGDVYFFSKSRRQKYIVALSIDVFKSLEVAIIAKRDKKHVFYTGVLYWINWQVSIQSEYYNEGIYKATS